MSYKSFREELLDDLLFKFNTIKKPHKPIISTNYVAKIAALHGSNENNDYYKELYVDGLQLEFFEINYGAKDGSKNIDNTVLKNTPEEFYEIYSKINQNKIKVANIKGKEYFGIVINDEFVTLDLIDNNINNIVNEEGYTQKISESILRKPFQYEKYGWEYLAIQILFK